MTLIMGVLNVTPDSFSDGGDFADRDAAIERGLSLARLGADIIDVGGESTRPGATRVTPEEELTRTMPVVRALVAGGLTVSIDTLRAATAAAAIKAGATLVNDVSGGKADPEMFGVIADTVGPDGMHADVAVGHWRGIPDLANGRSHYVDVVQDVRRELAARIIEARAAGIVAERIIVDPGLGFDKTAAHGWALLAQLNELADPGFRVLIGASRKRMLGELVAGTDPRDRDLVTSVVSAFAARQGAWAVRVHDVAGTAQALAVAKAWTIGEDSETRGHR